MVIEVGVSEHLSALHSDAHFWISTSGGRTRVVLLIAIDLESRSIIMERWGDVAPIYPHATAATPGPYFWPRKIQFVAIEGNSVVGAPLVIPLDLVFDIGNVPVGVLPTDFTFDATELLAFSHQFWTWLT